MAAPKRPTIITVAKAAGVTDGTVSRALRGDPRVKAETREKVLAAAEQLGYRPHLQARALKEGRSGLLGVISDSGSWVLYNDFFGRLLSGLADAAGADGKRLLLSFPNVVRKDDNPLHDDVRLSGLQDLGDGRVDAGVVLGGRTPRADELKRLRSSGVPVVWVNAVEPVPGFSQLLAGAGRRAESAGRLLAAQGHRKVGFMGLYQDSAYNDASLAGLKAGLGASGKIQAVALDHWDTADPVRLAPHLDRCLRAGCTAVLASNYDQGQVLLDLALARGLKVPADLSVLSFGPQNSGLRAQKLSLSCMICDLQAGGVEAYRLLKLAMDGGAPQVSELIWELAPGGGTLGPAPV